METNQLQENSAQAICNDASQAYNQPLYEVKSTFQKRNARINFETSSKGGKEES